MAAARFGCRRTRQSASILHPSPAALSPSSPIVPPRLRMLVAAGASLSPFCATSSSPSAWRCRSVRQEQQLDAARTLPIRAHLFARTLWLLRSCACRESPHHSLTRSLCSPATCARVSRLEQKVGHKRVIALEKAGKKASITKQPIWVRARASTRMQQLGARYRPEPSYYRSPHTVLLCRRRAQVLGLIGMITGEVGNLAAYGDRGTPTAVITAVGCVGTRTTAPLEAQHAASSRILRMPLLLPRAAATSRQHLPLCADHHLLHPLALAH